MEYLSRRRFLKISAATFAGAAASTQLAPLSRIARAADAPAKGIVTIPDVLRHVLLALRRNRLRPRRQAVEVRRQPEGPAEPWPAVPARHRRRRCALRSRSPAEAADPPRRARQGGVDGGDVGRGLRLHRRPDAEDQGAARPGSRRRHHARDRPALLPARAEELGRDQLRRPVVRAMPRPARRRVRADVRRRPGFARADRHREHRLPRPDRIAPGREHAQLAGAGIRPGGRAAHSDHRRRSPLLGRREQGEILAADRARHRSRAAAGVDERARHRGPLRHGVRRKIRPRLRQVRRRGQGLHARMGRRRNRPRREPDPRHGARVRESPAGDSRAPGPARRLERRRHAAQPGHRAPVRAARQLGSQGRALPVGRHEGRALSAAHRTRSRTSRRPTAPTARATRSPTKESPPASATRR